MLGFDVTEKIQKELIDTGDQFGDVSWEVVPDFLNDADIIQVNLADPSVQAGLETNEIWNLIPAVKNGKTYIFNTNFDRKPLYIMDKLLDFYHKQFMILAGN